MITKLGIRLIYVKNIFLRNVRYSIFNDKYAPKAQTYAGNLHSQLFQQFKLEEKHDFFLGFEANLCYFYHNKTFLCLFFAIKIKC